MNDHENNELIPPYMTEVTASGSHETRRCIDDGYPPEFVAVAMLNIVCVIMRDFDI